MLSFLLNHWTIFTGGGTALLFGASAALLRWVGPTGLIAHWRAILAALVFAVFSLTVVVLYVMLEHSLAELSDANAKYAKLDANYDTVVSENQELSTSNVHLGQVISTQSAAITEAASEAQAAKAEGASAVAAAIAKQQADRQTITQLNARIADPASNKGTCEDEIDAIRNGL